MARLRWLRREHQLTKSSRLDWATSLGLLLAQRSARSKKVYHRGRRASCAGADRVEDRTLALATNQPVCVTGVSGFIGSQLCADLLARGYPVRGTVRNASDTERHRVLLELPGAAERLELISADLLDPGSFDAAVAGCEYILHTASPYVITVKDPQRELVDPAVQGTLAVLEAAARLSGIKRVVLTSSMAAVTDEPDSNHTLTEDDWNEKSSLTRNPYYFSKVCAERAAWDFMKESARGFDLVVINPYLVLGPSLVSSLNTSNQIIVDLLGGGYPGIINVAWGVVDVRDVSLAHILAMERPGSSGRYVCGHETMTMRAIVELLRKLGPDRHKLPSLALDNRFGNGVVRMAAYFQPKGVRSFLRTHLGRIPKFDNGKIRRDLGLEFRPVEDTLRDTVADLARWGHLKL